MRIATRNLLHSTTSIQDRVEHLIDLLVEENLDFLCLQEVLNPETAGFVIVQRLGEALGLPHSDFIGLPDDNHGVAMLSRYPLVREIPEPLVWSKPMLVTRSEVGGRNVYVLNLHASWGSRNGTHRMQEVLYADNLATQFFGRAQGRRVRYGFRSSASYRLHPGLRVGVGPGWISDVHAPVRERGLPRLDGSEDGSE